MTLEVRRKYTGTGKCLTLILTECPACGAEFPPGSGSGRADHLLNDHVPEDFGLSPMGDV